ncbi:hypothetical protein PPERSA_04427 [Pseudocohnilembus persalinus]|uniref:Uncharacterized protein n=1 Tax=Pseudocohnilembus persalinus TaxID=266149 RepID=A0A0V0QQT2_PSEPJ|nr:hypothetical protein PPERSA_04427 [Pseudocohnilembus persalinus]|eukprot:KRX04612.1 hypothetical protein PPERSA_04427 [Pseudocohnilembus persalinus]
MSLALVNKKFDVLNEKERKLHNYYDPVNKHTKQHPNIEDIREDYKEDFKNYGFNRFQVKEFQHDEEEINRNIPTKESKDLYNFQTIKQKANLNIRPWSSNKNTYKKLGQSNSQKQINFDSKSRPLTSMTLKTPQNQILNQNQNYNQLKQNNQLIGIITPQGNNYDKQRNISSAQTQQNYYSSGSQNFQQKQQLKLQQRPVTAQIGRSSQNQNRDKGDKYWINTKKFDKQDKSKQIKNYSALNKIVVDVNQNQYQMAGDINPIHQHVLSQRFNDQKIYIDESGRAHNFARDQDLFQSRKKSPSQSEKEQIFKNFKEAREQLTDDFNRKQLREGLKSPEQPKISYQVYQSYIAKIINQEENNLIKNVSQQNIASCQRDETKQDFKNQCTTSKNAENIQNIQKTNFKHQKPMSANQQNQKQHSKDKKKERPATAQSGLLTNLDYTVKFSNKFLKTQNPKYKNQRDQIWEDEEENEQDDYSNHKSFLSKNNSANYSKEQNGKSFQKNSSKKFNQSQKNSKKTNKQKQSELSEQDIEEEEYLVVKNQNKIITKMKEIKSLVMSLQQGQQQIFVQDQNQTIPPFEDINWNNLQRDQTSNFSMVAIDLKTMNFISMEQINVENGKLVNVQLPKVSRKIDFKRIFNALFLESDHTDDTLQSKPFFYLMQHERDEIIGNSSTYFQNNFSDLQQKNVQLSPDYQDPNQHQNEIQNQNKNMIKQLDNSDFEDNEIEQKDQIKTNNHKQLNTKKARPQTAAVKRPQTAKLGKVQNLTSLQNDKNQQQNKIDYNNNDSNIIKENSFEASNPHTQQSQFDQDLQQNSQQNFQYTNQQQNRKDAVINHFAAATNTFGGQRLTPIENYQMITERHSQTHYRPKSGKNLSGFFSTKNNNSGHFSGLLSLKQQIQYQQSQKNIIKENPQFKQQTKIINNNMQPYNLQKDFKQKRNNFISIGVRGSQYQIPDNKYNNYDDDQNDQNYQSNEELQALYSQQNFNELQIQDM